MKWGLDGWLYCATATESAARIELVKAGGSPTPTAATFASAPTGRARSAVRALRNTAATATTGATGSAATTAIRCIQFVLADHYLRRNKLVAAANGKVDVPEQAGAAEVFPRSRTIARYNDLYAANRFTSANSTIVYRDDLFGPAFEGNAFISEPVHNLVHREVMRRDGLMFASRRADDEKDSEFLASADNWFRPAMLATGPDGALWVADMYRQTIEHPEWIPIEIQKQIDLRAGSDMGRIYRVFPVGRRPRKMPRLDKMSTAELVAAMDSPSGWQRDMVQQLLVWKPDTAAIEPLRKLAADSTRPAARVQALWTLELLGGLEPAQIARALADPQRRGSATCHPAQRVAPGRGAAVGRSHPQAG